MLFKIPKTKRRLGDFEDRFEKGLWLGMTIQSGENMVATDDGVYRVGGVIRCAPDQRWSADMVNKIVGTPSQPKPGSETDRIPTFAKQQEDRRGGQGDQFSAARQGTETPVRPAYIYANDVASNLSLIHI